MDSIAAIFRAEYGRVMAAIVRRTGGDFDVAEEAVGHAFESAIARWREDGLPENPQAWLMRVARNRAIDVVRAHSRHRAKSDDVREQALARLTDEPNLDLGDDRLRLIFTCCHPALSQEAQVALTLRTVCGLETEAVARAFLVAPTTMAQRLVRAKNKIRAAKIPYRVPEPEALTERIAAVGAVVYLVFNAGYSAPLVGDANAEADLGREAEWLARMLLGLLPGDRELSGLLALILLHGSRSAARTTESGDPILLEDQDRTKWDHAAISEGRELALAALRGGPPGPYAVQAAIAACHGDAARASDTDWPQICGLYDILYSLTPTPVVALNRAAAIAMARGPEFGLERLAEIGDALADYPHFHSARAELLRRLGEVKDAERAYRRALELTESAPDRRFLERRLAELGLEP